MKKIRFLINQHYFLDRLCCQHVTVLIHAMSR